MHCSYLLHAAPQSYSPSLSLPHHSSPLCRGSSISSLPAVVPPEFLPSPSAFPDLLVLAGSSVSIPCMATGFPPPTFSWALNLGGNSLVHLNLENDRISIPAGGMGDGTLTISPVEVSDSNTLICRASNSVSQGPVNNYDVTLRVIGQPTVLQMPPQNLIPVAGQQVTLPCDASVAGGITLHYRWIKDHTLLVVDNQVNGNLILPSLEEDQSDNGLYSCSIVLGVGGLNAEPLVYPIGDTLLTVQGKATTTTTLNKQQQNKISTL